MRLRILRAVIYVSPRVSCYFKTCLPPHLSIFTLPYFHTCLPSHLFTFTLANCTISNFYTCHLASVTVGKCHRRQVWEHATYGDRPCFLFCPIVWKWFGLIAKTEWKTSRPRLIKTFYLCTQLIKDISYFFLHFFAIRCLDLLGKNIIKTLDSGHANSKYIRCFIGYFHTKLLFLYTWK